MGLIKILVVDDEERIVNIVRSYLEKDGFQVVTAEDGRQALDVARREHPDLVVLDLMLPAMSGWDVCRTLRAESRVPIIMLTARDEDVDKIVGLELGADDYVTKPFNPRELTARVHAVLRRSQSARQEQRMIAAEGLEIDPERHEVKRDGHPISLTRTEFGLLQSLAEQPGRVFTRLQLLERVQSEEYEGYERSIDSHIRNLRQKIEPDPRQPHYVLTVFGVGYKFTEQPRA